MPVYVYKNMTTGETFEVQQRITESAWTEHPATGDPVKRIVQPVGIAFKGSGFYVTDSRTSSKKPSAAKANDDSAKSDAPTKGDASTSTGDGSASKAESTASSSTKDATKKESNTTGTKKDSRG